jgi:hypothetical protein
MQTAYTLHSEDNEPNSLKLSDSHLNIQL